MRFRATAVNSERSNAAGAVELECSPAGLCISYHGVFALHEGYAPGALARGSSVDVPWPAVLSTLLEGDQLYLEVDSRVTPLNRLCLAAFSSGEQQLPLQETRRRQLIVRLASAGLALSAALAAFASARGAGAGPSVSLAVSAAVLTALSVLGVGFWADRLIGMPSPRLQGDSAREVFLAELSRYVPALVRGPAPLPKPRAPLLWQFERFLPRTTAAIVITLSAALLGALLTTRVIVLDEGMTRRPDPGNSRQKAPKLREPAPGPDHAVAATPIASLARPSQPPPSQPPLAAGDSVMLGESCHCKRSDSPLWTTPIPKLSLLVLSQRVRKGRGEDENQRKKYLEVELAVVNNGKTDIPEVALLVEFFERDPPPSSKRYSVSTRPLFYAGPLRPAQAIKWSVEAQGIEFEAHNPVPGDVGPFGDDAAPSNLFAELLSANHRPVRLHAALLLSFLGDPRARDAVLTLREALREDEAPYLNRLLQAQSPVRVCNLRLEQGRHAGSACLFNASVEAKKDLGLRVRALKDEVSHAEPVGLPPEVTAESSFRVPGELSPDSGRTLSFSFDLGSASVGAYEAFADRFDLLPQ